MRRGYTTGSCAAAAACGAAQALLSGGEKQPEEIRLMTPKGIEVRIPVENVEINPEENRAVCSVRKDSGDDPDVTNRAIVCAEVFLRKEAEPPVRIDGGEGVGRVTKPGLACKVGEAAINPVPRKMIQQEVRKVMKAFDCRGGLDVIISIPDGKRLAEKTFNPKLGIVGGISVLGTTGIVEPMSEQALIDTIKVEINVAKATGVSYLVLTPGNYGETFLKESRYMDALTYVKCSNFIGEALDAVREKEFAGVLLVGHIGKLIKVAAGMMNTHSRYGDRRMETLSAAAESVGGSRELTGRLMKCVTTEDAIGVIKGLGPEFEARLWEKVTADIQSQMRGRTGDALWTETMIYSNQYGYLGESAGTEEFLRRAKKEKGE